MTSLSRWLLCAALAIAPVRAQSGDADAKARSVADAALQILDKKQCRDFYKQMFHSKVKEKITEDNWAKMCEDVQAKIGTAQSRKHVGNEAKGEVIIVRYEAEYSVGPLIDTVVVSPEGEALKVVGITATPKQ